MTLEELQDLADKDLKINDKSNILVDTNSNSISVQSNSLIIVESPSKAKTLKRFLGDEYAIEASVGHVRDLPKSDLGVDVDNGFAAT